MLTPSQVILAEVVEGDTMTLLKALGAAAAGVVCILVLLAAMVGIVVVGVLAAWGRL